MSGGYFVRRTNRKWPKKRKKNERKSTNFRLLKIGISDTVNIPIIRALKRRHLFSIPMSGVPG